MYLVRFACFFTFCAFATIPVAHGVELENEATHDGMCDASAAAAIGRDLFVVASDEDNVLRVYRREGSGPAVQSFPLNGFLKPDGPDEEVDIEGATQIGDVVYWVSSHGRNKNAKKRPSRQRLFATRFKVDGDRVKIETIGQPYGGLLDALLDASQFDRYALKEASKLAPKERGGLNIEGLAATPDGKLLLGLRNPLYESNAILIPLENPAQVLRGAKPRFGSSIELDLGGVGVRSIEYIAPRKCYAVIAGPHDEGPCKLFRWSGDPGQSPEAVDVDLADLQAEGIVVYPDEEFAGLHLIGDEGSRPGCSDLPKPRLDGKFRSAWVKF